MEDRNKAKDRFDMLSELYKKYNITMFTATQPANPEGHRSYVPTKHTDRHSGPDIIMVDYFNLLGQ